MDLGLKDKRVLIGGGSKGLGFACADALLAEGCHVAIVSRSRENLQQAQGILGGNKLLTTICADISSTGGVTKCIAEVNAWGNVDILVNNTGGPPPGTVVELSESMWLKGHEALFLYVQRMVEEFVPTMRARRWGRVITISSIVAREPAANLALSSVYRSALAAYLKLLAKETAADGVTVNTVLPGSFYTERTKTLLKRRAHVEGKTTEEMLLERRQFLPQKRYQDPKELGALVAFLASEQAAGISGANIPIDGGMLAGVW